MAFNHDQSWYNSNDEYSITTPGKSQTGKVSSGISQKLCTLTIQSYTIIYMPNKHIHLCMMLYLSKNLSHTVQYIQKHPYTYTPIYTYILIYKYIYKDTYIYRQIIKNFD